MQDYYKKESIKICKNMIKAFFIERKVDKVLNYVNPNNFTWLGPGENDMLTNIDDVRKCFTEHCDIVTAAYKIISEEYSIGASSNDTCIVIAKCRFQGLNERQHYQSFLHFSFYVQLINNKLMVSHYHVHIPVKKQLYDNAAQFIINKSAKNANELIKMDLQYQHSLLHNFYDTKHTPMKSFCYEEGLPYCYVNQLFLNLIGYDKLNDFISQDKFSSLAHIHPDDQERYIKHLNECFPKVLHLNMLNEWQWHASYNIMYRTRAYNLEEKKVFEWGNLFTLNGHPIVNSFVVPLEHDSTPLHARCIVQNMQPSTMGSSAPVVSDQQQVSSLLNDVGIRIGNIMVIYPKHHNLIIKDKAIDLTPIEFKLMLMLTENINNPIDSEKIYNSLWNDSELKLTSFTLKTHISNLRHKLKLASDDSIKLVHIRNKGYCLSIPEF
ncbi:MAG: winged helix-turn-helix domain-containing protein [Selenomonadaceae bacterium]|nr:winged helix-turn-helix domain-containing protein [Selenomonadaceae bacterium]